MYLIDKETPITPQYIGKAINKFESVDKPRMKRYLNYYEGNQEILSKQATDIGKPCNRVVVNYCGAITNTYQGYITGIPISYTSDQPIDNIINVLNYNDVHSEDAELLKDALVYGRACEVLWIDSDHQQRFKRVDPREIIPIYSNTIDEDLLYVIRYYSESTLESDSDSYIVELYDSAQITRYRSTVGFSSLELLEQIPHFYKQVPITIFDLNRDNKSCFDSVMTLQDAYNKLLSAEVDDFEAFADAYLVLKGIAADPEDLAAMKEARILIMDQEDSAEYLTKSISDTQIQNMLQNINDQIHKISNAPDFNDDKFMAQSGIAMKYKLIGFENISSAIVANMTRALQKRIELICEVLSLTGDSVWRDVDIHFTRNLPENVLEIAQTINQLRGLVSDETLLAQLPFIKNVADELKLIQDQKQQNIELYSFPAAEDTEDTAIESE